MFSNRVWNVRKNQGVRFLVAFTKVITYFQSKPLFILKATASKYKQKAVEF